MRQGLKVSLIIPVYNESGKIRACMDNIAGVDGLHEVIFADGGSTDGTPDIIGGRYRVLRCGKGRARQMNAAAKEAAGDILWFSHCDSLLPKDGAEEIIAAVNAGARFGCFHIGFDYDGPFMGCNTLNSNLRARLWHIAFGDQGIFMDKDLFFEVNGFPDLPIMEDYELSRIMKRRSEKLYLLPEVEAYAKQAQEEHSEHSAKEGVIRDFLDREIPVDWEKQTLFERKMYWAGGFANDKEKTKLKRRERVCAVEIWCEAFGGEIRYFRRSDAAEINAILARIPGWERCQKTMRVGCAYGVQKGFIRCNLL